MAAAEDLPQDLVFVDLETTGGNAVHDRITEVALVRVSNGVAQWVNVGRGARVGDLIEVFGALKDGDTIVRRGTDESRDGSKVNAQMAKVS